MPNIINNLLSSETTNTSTTSSSSEQTVKDKPSLFDSLLSSNTVVKDEKTVTNTAPTTAVKEVKTEEKAVIVDGSEVVSEEVKLDATELESVKIEPEKVEEQKLTSTTSLLDRLILEAKKM